MKVPGTLLEFQEMFPDEEACWAQLRRVRQVLRDQGASEEAGAILTKSPPIYPPHLVRGRQEENGAGSLDGVL